MTTTTTTTVDDAFSIREIDIRRLSWRLMRYYRLDVSCREDIAQTGHLAELMGEDVGKAMRREARAIKSWLGRSRPIEHAYNISDDVQPFAEMVSREASIQFAEKILSHLSPDDQLLATYYLWFRQPAREVGIILDIPEVTVRDRARNIRKSVQSRITDADAAWN